VRFLVDNALSPLIAADLRQAGHNAVHIREIGLTSAADSLIFERAAAEDRVLVSADADFGTLLALRHSSKPSVILFRLENRGTPSHQSELLRLNLASLQDSLQQGCIAVLEDRRVRVRYLPFGSGRSE
jgi:predicted nuclease of predicted toxin-antitoxin system